MPVRQLRLLHPALLFVGLGALVYAGCSSSSAEVVAVSHPTMIEVAPEDFLGNVPCTEGPGLKRYVATLFDTNYVAQGGASGVEPTVTEAAGAGPDFQLPSSRPTPCLAGVGFGLVVAGRHYDVKIDGYDTDDLEPRALGSRQMVSPAASTGELATPRWTAHCEDAIAIDLTIVRADHCTTFAAADAAAPGSVRIALGSLLGELDCGSGPDEVDHFEVSLTVGDAPAVVQDVPCDAQAEALFTNLPPRSRVSTQVTAVSAPQGEAEGTAVAGASCNAYTVPEASVDAECTPLLAVGSGNDD